MRFLKLSTLVLLCVGVGLGACSAMPSKSFPRAQQVDIDRYMGPWYVIANIPPSPTKNAYNSIERYTQGKKNQIDVDFTYREGSFDGEKKKRQPTGYVLPDTDNAIWGMQFFWPLKMQFVITYISPEYQTTIVAREKRDYAWIMARTPKISDSTYQNLVERVKKLGYDTDKLRRVPPASIKAARRSVALDSIPAGLVRIPTRQNDNRSIQNQYARKQIQMGANVKQRRSGLIQR